jgi:glycine oxidase
LALIHGIVDRSSAAEVFRPTDGAVDNVRLLSALRSAVAASPRVTLVNDFVSGLALSRDGVRAHTRGGRDVASKRAVLAAGAWSPRLSGLPRPLPVRPLKGQMLALGASPLERPMMDDAVYLVPRGGETLVGATVEEAGFDITVSPDAVAALRASAVALCPELASAQITRSWAGIRPASPDMLPILGADAEWPSLIYACGHSKNGVLLAPATARAIAALCRDETPPADIGPFSVSRFL